MHRTEKLYRHFVDNGGTLHIGDDKITVELETKTYTPVLLEAGFAELEVPIPWWDDRRLRFRFRP